MIRRRILLSIVAIASFSAPATSFAGLGGLGKFIPGGQSVSGAAMDPDRFLSDTVETTKFMMVAAALLAQASRDKDQLSSLSARIDAIQKAQDCKELDAHKAEFQADMTALTENQDSTANIQRAYAEGSAEQKKLIAAATFNIMLGVWRNVKLSGEASQLLGNVRANPVLLMKVGRLKDASELIFMEVKATGSISGSMAKLMSAMKVDAPAQAESTKPQPVVI